MKNTSKLSIESLEELFYYNDLERYKTNPKKSYKIPYSYYCNYNYYYDENENQIYKLESIDLIKLNEELIKSIKKLTDFNINEIDEYCIFRLLVLNKMDDKNNYEIDTYRGYYNEISLSDIKVKEYKKLCEDLKNVFELKTDIDKIFYVLKLEYGYLLNSIKDMNYVSIDKIDINDLEVGAQDHYIKIQNHEIINTYIKMDKYPIGITIKLLNKHVQEGNNITNRNVRRLVDGYHRYSAALRRDAKQVFVINLERR